MKHTASLAQGTGVNQSTYGPKEDGDIDEQIMLCLGVGFGDIAKEKKKMMKEFRDLVERRCTRISFYNKGKPRSSLRRYTIRVGVCRPARPKDSAILGPLRRCNSP